MAEETALDRFHNYPQKLDEDESAFNNMKNATTSKADTLMATNWSEKLSDRGISGDDFDQLYKSRWGSLDKDSYGQVRHLYDPSWYESLEKDEFPSEIIESGMKDAEMYMGEMKAGIDLKKTRADDFAKSKFGNGSLGTLERKKVPGLKGFFQRLLPGGETGYAK